VTYHLVFSQIARDEIHEAAVWIAGHSPSAAARWLNGLERGINSLKQFPHRCALAPESEKLGVELRQYLYGRRGGRYRVLFIVRGNSVIILHVRHGARHLLEPQEIRFALDE
jgi:plasmid stabilization system protein ParE